MGRATMNQYEEMRKIYSDIDNIYLSNKEAEKMVRKITRFIFREKSKAFNTIIKPIYPIIRFYGHSDSGAWYEWKNEIRISNNPTIYIICHECAHMAHDINAWPNENVIETGSDHHGVKYLSCLRKIATYVRKGINKGKNNE
jgi:hypothetical protein